MVRVVEFVLDHGLAACPSSGVVAVLQAECASLLAIERPMDMD